MNEPQPYGQLFGTNAIDKLDDLCQRQPEFRMLAAGFRPETGTASREPDTHADLGLHAKASGLAFEQADLIAPLENRKHPLAQALSSQHQAYHLTVLAAVAEQQYIPVREVWKRSNQFGFRSTLQAMSIRLSGGENLFEDLAQLVDLDGINALVRGAITGLLDGFDESLVQVLNS